MVSRAVEGGIHRYTYTDLSLRSKQLAKVLRKLGVHPADRVGTLAWNTYRHMELYYAVSGLGAVLHTLNPRLFGEQLVYIVNHAGACSVAPPPPRARVSCVACGLCHRSVPHACGGLCTRVW